MPQSSPHTLRAFVDAVLDAASPRGRCDRRGLLMVASVLLGAQAVQAGWIILAGMAADGPASGGITAAILWFSTTAVAKRLHDVGRSAWGIAWAALGVVGWTIAVSLVLALVWGLEALEPGQPAYVAALVAAFLPVLALTLWLHVTPGTSGANRFGPEPGKSGFSMPDRAAASLGGIAVAG